ncbi:MAG TPA: class I SAM-dependent methyltransferase [Solirubrobacterales bacterium]|jgi:ubiquinone/menaquinone biosynthesis C-methylase UbiE|nr:class I SAM-dependent methyltransferase [Solirubrobacterales bacterium]
MPSTETFPNRRSEVIESRLIAALYNPFLWLGEKLGMAARRRELLAEAHGAVLEIGAGTGLNLPHYPADLDQLVLTEPGVRMGERIDLGRSTVGMAVRVEQAAAEDLPFADESFDTVVSTLVLCTVADPQRAMSEVARVLRPGGRLLFLEHVCAESGWRRAMQRCSARAWATFADGCHCDRATLETIEAEMRVESVESGRWRGMPAIVKPLVWGRAVA